MAVRSATRRFVVHTRFDTTRCHCPTGNSLGDPDPSGKRVAVLRRALESQTHIKAFFWECAHAAPSPIFRVSLHAFCVRVPRSFASLFQKPRTREQDDAFQRSLKVLFSHPPPVRH